MHRQIYIETDRKIERCTDNSMHVQVLTYGINICTRAVIFGHIASQRLIHIRTTQYKQISLKNVRKKSCTRSVDFNQKYQKYVLRSKSRQVLTVHHSFQFYGNKFGKSNIAPSSSVIEIFWDSTIAFQTSNVR